MNKCTCDPAYPTAPLPALGPTRALVVLRVVRRRRAGSIDSSPSRRRFVTRWGFCGLARGAYHQPCPWHYRRSSIAWGVRHFTDRGPNGTTTGPATPEGAGFGDTARRGLGAVSGGNHNGRGRQRALQAPAQSPAVAQTPGLNQTPGLTQTPGVTGSTGTCAENPGQDACAVTAVSLNTAGLGNCSPDCELSVGTTVEIAIQAVYNDGSAGPVTSAPGGTGPEVAFSSTPAPSGSFTLSGVVSGTDGATDVQLTADEASTAPAVVQVTYNGLNALTPPIASVVSPTCGVPGRPACFEVNGALLTVVAVATATAGDTPVPGAVADIVQAGAASGTGAFVTGQPCYPQSGGATCGPAPSGEPATASAATCTTLNGGSCPLTAMWDGSGENFSQPDAVTLYPPPGYLVTAVSGCTAVGAGGPQLTCDVTVPDGSDPLTVTFGLQPVSLLTVNLAGPLEPGCTPTTCFGPTYDNDAVDGATVTATPTGATPGRPTSCQVEGGSPGDATSGLDASCTLELSPGTYSVAMPSTVETPDSEVDVAFAYITGEDPQTVALGRGQTRPSILPVPTSRRSP